MDKGSQRIKSPSRAHPQNRAADGVRSFPNDFHRTGEFIPTRPLHVGRWTAPRRRAPRPRAGETQSPATSPWSCSMLSEPLVTWHRAVGVAPGLPRLRPMRSELSPTRSHRRPELSQLQSRAWPCAVHSRPDATGGGPQPRLQGGLGRGLSTPRASSIGLPGGAAQTAAAVKVPGHFLTPDELLNPDLGGSAPLTGWTDPVSKSLSAHPARHARPYKRIN